MGVAREKRWPKYLCLIHPKLVGGKNKGSTRKGDGSKNISSLTHHIYLCPCPSCKAKSPSQAQIFHIPQGIFTEIFDNSPINDPPKEIHLDAVGYCACDRPFPKSDLVKVAKSRARKHLKEANQTWDRKQCMPLLARVFNYKVGRFWRDCLHYEPSCREVTVLSPGDTLPNPNANPKNDNTGSYFPIEQGTVEEASTLLCVMALCSDDELS